LTHIGRRSGKVRRTALEYHRLEGRLFVFNPWPQADWYQNILAEPRVTVQTDQGAMRAEARPLQSNVEYIDAFRMVERSPLLQIMLQAAGIESSLPAFLVARDRLPVVVFEPADVQSPPPLKADLRWLTPVVLAAAGLGFLVGRGDLASRKPKPWYKRLLGK
jgi:deazaflavin-dependent oxidoreductase (nitroreductase family)